MLLTNISLKNKVSPEEWKTRVDLAAAYRLVAMHGWDDLIFTHISARLDGPDHEFLINPYGLLFEEITASSLVRVDQFGNKVVDSPYDVNPAGFTIHSAIHSARENAKCVLHVHTVAGVAVSVQEHGLLPLSQNSLLPLSSLAYHEYEGIALREDEKVRLQRDLGDANNMILRNHGLLTCGTTIADAFVNMFFLQRSCEIQVAAMSGSSSLVHVPSPILKTIMSDAQRVTKGIGGELAWPALLRKLDRIAPGYDQ